jgi:hypothetical protein
MSKKSRRRNKKILGALGALGLGLALANRGKGTEMSNISVDSGRGGDSSSAEARAIANAVTTGKTIQDNMPIVPKKKSLNVQPEVITRGSGVMISDTGKKVPALKNNKQPYLNRMKDKTRLDALRAFRSNNAYRGDMMTAPSTGDIFESSGVDEIYQAAKKGGRIVKGKKTAVRKVGIAKRGFGRAMKRSK